MQALLVAKLGFPDQLQQIHQVGYHGCLLNRLLVISLVQELPFSQPGFAGGSCRSELISLAASFSAGVGCRRRCLHLASAEAGQ